MKQVILVRTDLKMSSGKIGAQCSHAAVSAADNSDKALVKEWKSEGMMKAVLKVSSEKELLEFWKKAKLAKLATALIRDAGRTEVEPGTITCLGIGPDKDEKIDKITGMLKIL